MQAGRHAGRQTDRETNIKCVYYMYIHTYLHTYIGYVNVDRCVCARAHAGPCCFLSTGSFKGSLKVLQGGDRASGVCTLLALGFRAQNLAPETLAGRICLSESDTLTTKPCYPNHQKGVSKMRGTIFWGPYNKDPAI